MCIQRRSNVQLHSHTQFLMVVRERFLSCVNCYDGYIIEFLSVIRSRRNIEAIFLPYLLYV